MNNTSQILDELLVMQAQQGDRQAMQVLVERWNRKLIYQSYVRTDNWEESRDIVQEVWKWVVSNLFRLKDASRFNAWIRTIVNRKSIDWVRKQQRERTQKEQIAIEYGNIETANTDDASDFSIADDPNEDPLVALDMAMRKLPTETKLILTLYYLESNSIKTIAQVMGLPSGTVKSKLYYAREKLKELLNK